jgi:hypothetical protein
MPLIKWKIWKRHKDYYNPEKEKVIVWEENKGYKEIDIPKGVY